MLDRLRNFADESKPGFGGQGRLPHDPDQGVQPEPDDDGSARCGRGPPDAPGGREPPKPGGQEQEPRGRHEEHDGPTHAVAQSAV